MRSWIWIAALGAAALASGQTRAARAAQPASDGWINLFNGQNLDGWTKMNHGDWGVANGAITYSGGGNGWLRTNDTFTDFHVIAEWRFPDPEGNHDSGLFFRSGAEGDPWPSRGYQLNMGPGDNLGSVAGVQGSSNVPTLIKKPGGEWNTWDLIVIGQDATLIVNGRKAWDAHHVGIPEGGYLGWEGEGPHFEVRSVKVKRLAASAPR